MFHKAAFFTHKKGGITSSDADVTAWIAAVGAANTNQSEVNALTAFVAGIKSDFAITLLSQKWDRLWVYSLGTAAASAVDLVARASHTLVSSPTFTPLGGYTGNGTSSYINSGFPTNAGGNYSQNNAHFGVDIAVAESRTGAFHTYAGSFNSGNANCLNKSSNNTQWNWGANSAATSDNTTFSVQTGIVMCERTASGPGFSTIYQAGVSLGIGSTASQATTSANFFVLADNNGSGTPSIWTNARVRGFFSGASLGATQQANFNARWGTLKTALGVS